LAFYAGSKYIKFIKFNFAHQNLWAWENLLSLHEGGGENTPKQSSDLNVNQTIRFSISENPTIEVSSFCLKKVVFFIFFARRTIMDELFNLSHLCVSAWCNQRVFKGKYLFLTYKRYNIEFWTFFLLLWRRWIVPCFQGRFQEGGWGVPGLNIKLNVWSTRKKIDAKPVKKFFTSFVEKKLVGLVLVL
jgi:hypothetical protein